MLPQACTSGDLAVAASKVNWSDAPYRFRPLNQHPAQGPRDEVVKSDRGDLLCLALIGLFSALPYVAGLGFYSDDWYVLGQFQQGLGEALRQFAARPAHGMYLGALFETFGYAPLGYHLVNSAVLIGAICLLYKLLRELAFARSLAFAASVVALVLPQMSTIRVWISASQIPLSMLFAAASMRWQLQFARSGRRPLRVLAVMAALLSVGAYEIFGPLIVAFSIALAWRSLPAGGAGKAAAILAPAAAVAFAGFAKALVSGRAQAVPVTAALFRWDYDWRTDYGLNLFAALHVNFVATAERWLAGVTHIGTFPPIVLVASAIAAGLTYWRLAKAKDAGQPRHLLLLGLLTFFAGYGVFLFTDEIMFSPNGIANRVSVAAALGVAMIIVSLIAFVERLLPMRIRSAAFASIIAVLTFVGTASTASSAAYWTKAAELQARFLVDVRRDLRAIPLGSTVIIDGICPYEGPSIVLEDGWAASGLMTHALGRRITADTVSPRMRLTQQGVATSIYNFRFAYPFGAALFVYDVRRHSVAPLSDPAAAISYFRSPNRWPLRCPSGYVGQGVLL